MLKLYAGEGKTNFLKKDVDKPEKVWYTHHTIEYDDI